MEFAFFLKSMATPPFSGCKRGQCALMGSAPTGRGEYPVPVAGGYSPRRGHSMANLKAGDALVFSSDFLRCWEMLALNDFEAFSQAATVVA